MEQNNKNTEQNNKNTEKIIGIVATIACIIGIAIFVALQLKKDVPTNQTSETTTASEPVSNEVTSDEYVDPEINQSSQDPYDPNATPSQADNDNRPTEEPNIFKDASGNEVLDVNIPYNFTFKTYDAHTYTIFYPSDYDLNVECAEPMYLTWSDPSFSPSYADKRGIIYDLCDQIIETGEVDVSKIEGSFEQETYEQYCFRLFDTYETTDASGNTIPVYAVELTANYKTKTDDLPDYKCYYLIFGTKDENQKYPVIYFDESTDILKGRYDSVETFFKTLITK